MRKPHGLAGKGAGLRFLQEHVLHTGDGCLLWPMHCDGRGYATVGVPKELQVSKGGHIRNAARVMCELAHGNAPTPNHRAALSCSNPACVHPGHVSWKTRGEIVRKGERHHNFKTHRRTWHKLTPDAVEQIKILRPSATLVTLAARFNVDRETIRRVCCGLTWTGDFQAKIARPDYGLPRALKRSKPTIARARVLTNYPYMRGRGDAAALVDAINEIVSRRFPDYARADICQSLLLSILEGETTLEDLKAGSAACIKRYYKMHPGRFGPISLDAPMRGFENLAMIDTLPSDARVWA